MLRNYCIVFTLIVCFILACSPADQKPALKLGEFGAFYTKINSGEKFEEYSRTGDYADIVVDLGDGDATFVFWRGSSYLPYLQTKNGRWYVDEIIPRSGDGSGMMPDKTNTFSFVRIIENNPEKVTIHWRYLPDFTGTNPKQGVLPTKFVDEYFHLTPDRKVMRTIKKGTEKIDEWRDPKNITIQTFSLTNNGFEGKNIIPAGKSQAVPKVKGAPIAGPVVTEPVAWWKFDEAEGDVATENRSNQACPVEGNKSLWRRGVSGTALQFDGYHSVIRLSAAKGPKLSDALTLEGWVAFGAYPWSWVPIIQQCDDVPEEIETREGQGALLIGEEGREEQEEGEEDDKFAVVLKKEDDTGYFLGIDGNGQPGLKIRVGGVWEELVADFHLERRQWYHIAGTFDKPTGKMQVYVNGKPVAQKTVAKAPIELSQKDIQIGKGKDRRPINPVRMHTFIDSYSFDGLIDEVKIYDVALNPQQLAQSFSNVALTEKDRLNPEMDQRVLPAGKNTGEFGAYYTHLKFYDIWDNLWRFSEHPDVVVAFDKLPSKFVFWRGVGYIPMIVNEKGQWYSNEFNETWNKTGGQGCQEPMSDKESFTNHVRIIENTPARVVVHWRYPLLDVNHVMANYDDKTGWCDWSDWYYYIYPDGIAAKTMHLWTHGERNHEWQESMAIFGPDQHPEDIIEKEKTVTMVNLNGDFEVYHWRTAPPDNVDQPEDKVIQYINYTGDYDPVTIGYFEGSNVYGGELTPYAVFPTWNHWPVSQMPSDGRYASYPDRSAHSSLTHVFLPVYREAKSGKTPFYEKILMEGMLTTKPTDLVPLAKSWMNAPAISEASGCTGVYDKAQRAYVLTADSFPIAFNLDCSKESPLVNACFVIKNWDDNSPAHLEIDGAQPASGSDFRQGIVRDVDGAKTLILWIKREATGSIKIEIAK